MRNFCTTAGRVQKDSVSSAITKIGEAFASYEMGRIATLLTSTGLLGKISGARKYNQESGNRGDGDSKVARNRIPDNDSANFRGIDKYGNEWYIEIQEDGSQVWVEMGIFLKEEIMKVMQSFLIFFYVLDQCYEYYQENDLGGFLGTISPELWNDGNPIDKGVYDDWKTQNDIEILNNQNIVKAIYNFLEFYEKQYSYDFKETKKVLTCLVNDEMIKNSLKYVEDMYQKYSYVE